MFSADFPASSWDVSARYVLQKHAMDTTWYMCALACVHVRVCMCMLTCVGLKIGLLVQHKNANVSGTWVDFSASRTFQYTYQFP